MTRRMLVSGNWKMNLNHFEAIQLVQKLSYELVDHDFERVEVSVPANGREMLRVRVSRL